MSGSAITDQEVEKALDYLRENARPAAQARANREYVEQFRKTIKAQLMSEAHMNNPKLPLAAQEREAYADPRYVKHLEAIREAVEADEYHRFMLRAASAKVDAWRTQCSNKRAERV